MFFKKKNKIENINDAKNNIQTNLKTKIQEKKENILENVNSKHFSNINDISNISNIAYIPIVSTVQNVKNVQTDSNNTKNNNVKFSNEKNDIVNFSKNSVNVTNFANTTNTNSDSDQEEKKKINFYKNEEKIIKNKVKAKIKSEINKYVALTMALYLIGFIFQSNNKSFSDIDILSMIVYFDLMFLLFSETKNKLIQFTDNKDYNFFEKYKDQIAYQIGILILSGLFSGIFSCGILVRLNLYNNIYYKLLFFAILFFYKILMSYQFINLIFF